MVFSWHENFNREKENFIRVIMSRKSELSTQFAYFYLPREFVMNIYIHSFEIVFAIPNNNSSNTEKNIRFEQLLCK